ncbi:MAG: hypothetical protein GWO77_03815 [Bacteroidetes bacterium]|jgi:hypothetical protein|nr:hypothetical protein [Bacteroidota bacterium]NCF95974.1 hypothetical protein [Bacteroidota bacterium]NCG14750.1 hypothetical protein [Bacteroidota bacterium]NCG43640.1 hypothetical protein [Pseudomonadota bacterium]
MKAKKQYLKTTEWMWLVVAVLSLVEIGAQWTIDRSRAYLFVLFAITGVVMFILRRKARLAMEARWKSDQGLSDSDE